jgi:hypothetical protein
LHSGGANDFWGTINEYVVRNVAVSADLLRNEFSNQSAAGDIGTPGFLIWGTETANPAAKQPQPFVVT